MSAGGIKIAATRSCLNRPAIYSASFLSVFSTDNFNIFGMGKNNRTLVF